MAERHFACTQCGQCCNRAPELELGEAAALVDVFVLRLLMRIYSLPRSVSDYGAEGLPRELASVEFYQSKRLLSSFAAASWSAKVRRGAKAMDYIQYLSLSVLPLDLGTGSCNAVRENRCGIYPRRPLSCRSVPLHYSRPASAATRDLDAFTATPDYACATGGDAPLVIENDQIIDPATLSARTDGVVRARADGPWKTAIVHAMKAGQHGLPSPRAVEAQATRGALTVSMQLAWQIAGEAGLLAPGECRSLIAAQTGTIARLLTEPGLSSDARQTLLEMQRETVEALA
jgi:Fe-S-cluster containining protein